MSLAPAEKGLTRPQGEWVEDEKVRGTETFPDGSVYEGEYVESLLIRVYVWITVCSLRSHLVRPRWMSTHEST